MKLNEQIPRQVVEELDKYIVGQSQAKRSVAIACLLYTSPSPRD